MRRSFQKMARPLLLPVRPLLSRQLACLEVNATTMQIVYHQTRNAGTTFVHVPLATLSTQTR